MAPPSTPAARRARATARRAQDEQPVPPVRGLQAQRPVRAGSGTRAHPAVARLAGRSRSAARPGRQAPAVHHHPPPGGQVEHGQPAVGAAPGHDPGEHAGQTAPHRPRGGARASYPASGRASPNPDCSSTRSRSGSSVHQGRAAKASARCRTCCAPGICRASRQCSGTPVASWATAGGAVVPAPDAVPAVGHPGGGRDQQAPVERPAHVAGGEASVRRPGTPRWAAIRLWCS